LDLVVVNQVWDLAEARQVKSILDDARIPSFLGPGNVDNLDMFKGKFDGGVDVKTRYVDSQRALQAISRSMPPEPSVETEVSLVRNRVSEPRLGLDRKLCTELVV